MPHSTYLQHIRAERSRKACWVRSVLFCNPRNHAHGKPLDLLGDKDLHIPFEKACFDGEDQGCGGVSVTEYAMDVVMNRQFRA
jgi:hypothetical protein